MLKRTRLDRGSAWVAIAGSRCPAEVVVCALLLLTGLHLALAHSQPISEDEITEATRLLESGRLEEAQAIVFGLRTKPDPPLQVLFLSGALYSLTGHYHEAAEEFRLMLARDPTLLRPRLELARALFMAGQYNAARYHFEQVLASPLPEAVKANVLAYLTLIRERVPSFAFSFDIVSDSNPKQATSTSIVQIGGLLYRLNPSALAQPAIGTLLTGQGKMPLPSDPSWFARGYVERYDFPGGEADQGYGQLLAGKHIDFGPHGVDLEGGAHLATYSGHMLYQGAAWKVSDFIRVRPSVALNLAVEGRDLRYGDFPFLSGWQYAANGELRHAITLTSSIFGGITYIRGLATESPYAFVGYGINLRYTQEVKGGWIGSLFYQYSWYGFEGVNPFFGVVRDDSSNRLEVSVTNRYLAYKGFAPRLTVGMDERRSNIEIYSFRRTYVRVGVVTEF